MYHQSYEGAYTCGLHLLPVVSRAGINGDQLQESGISRSGIIVRCFIVDELDTACHM